MNHRWTSSLLVVAAISILFGCVPPDTGSPHQFEEIISEPVTLSEIDAVFQLGNVDAAIYGLNEIKASDLDSEVIAAVQCAYERCSRFNTSWHSETLSHPLVRINLVDVLIQAGRRGHPKIDETVLREYVLAVLEGSGENVRQRCLVILSYMGHSEDVDKIADAARATNDLVTYRYGVIALKWMRSGVAEDALKDLLRDSDTRKRESVADLFSDEIGYGFWPKAEVR